MSDIFNEFAKIAINQGLIKEAQKASNESNARFDSLSNDDIKALYGIEPNGEEKHIVEQAHPESVVIAPSYDKANGLVENLLERQDIMAWIATKPNDGKHTNERYVKANYDLTMSLLNTAMLLDKSGDEQLMSLADSCADRLNKIAVLPAFITLPFVIKALSGSAAAIGAWGLFHNFSGKLDNGVLSNAERAIEELEDVVSDNDAPGKNEDIFNLIADIRYVKNLNQELQSFSVEAANPEDIKRQTAQGKEMLNKYIKAIRILSKRITYVIAIFEAQESSPGWLASNLKDFGRGMESIYDAWVGTDLEDAVIALKTLKDSLNSSVSSMRKLYNAIKAKVESNDIGSLESLLNVKLEQEDEPIESGIEKEIKEEQPGLAYKQEEQPAQENEKNIVNLKDYLPYSE